MRVGKIELDYTLNTIDNKSIEKDIIGVFNQLNTVIKYNTAVYLCCSHMEEIYSYHAPHALDSISNIKSYNKLHIEPVIKPEFKFSVNKYLFILTTYEDTEFVYGLPKYELMLKHKTSYEIKDNLSDFIYIYLFKVNEVVE